jgi:ketosteroid isomerase-like protein
LIVVADGEDLGRDPNADGVAFTEIVIDDDAHDSSVPAARVPRMRDGVNRGPALDNGEAGFVQRAAMATDHDAILDALGRYSRGVDERDFASVAALFTPDATIDYSVPGGAVLQGRELAAWLGRAMAIFRMTQHHLGLPVIDVDGDAARTRVPVIATHVQERKGGGDSCAILYGTYTHTWIREAAAWRIRTLRFESHHGTGAFLGAGEARLFPAAVR